MDILEGEFRLPFTSPLWIVQWQSKALQKLPVSNQCNTVIVSCLRLCYKSYSLKKGWNRKIHKLELLAEWIFALWPCGNLKTILLLWVTTYEQIIWRQYSEIENSVTETRFSDINRTMLLKCVFLTAYQLNCFYRAMRADCFFERSHFLITLTSSLYYLFLQIPAEQQNCSSSTWDIFKSQFIWFVSFNFQIFLLLIIKTKTLHKHHERIIISCTHI